MSIIQSFRQALFNRFKKFSNAMTLPQQFLRYGNRGNMYPEWNQVVMNDKDLYTGYSYATIHNRATWTSKIAIENLRTESGNDDYEHPYLEIINDSRSFTNYQFWNDICTYLDLEGVYYLMAVRAVGENKVGAVQEFKLLNPYNIRRVLNKETLTVEGYVESRSGYIREIPKEMIIEMRQLNPFDESEPFALTDAAKESQFTLKTSGDFTRSALQHNINAPGILTTDIILEKEEFANFVSRIKSRVKGEPIFGNGQGAMTWQNMQTDLTKAGLKDITEINRESLFAVTGVSKTIMGIEQSGTTRETARVQKELYLEGQILPRIQLIIDALNQDYKNYYVDRYAPTIVVDNPLAVDHEAEMKNVEVNIKLVELYTTLVNKGYDRDIASRFVKGEIDIEQLGEPTNEPILPPVMIPQDDSKDDGKDDTVDTAEALKEVVMMIQASTDSQIKSITQNITEEQTKFKKRKKGV